MEAMLSPVLLCGTTHASDIASERQYSTGVVSEATENFVCSETFASKNGFPAANMPGAIVCCRYVLNSNKNNNMLILNYYYY